METIFNDKIDISSRLGGTSPKLMPPIGVFNGSDDVLNVAQASVLMNLTTWSVNIKIKLGAIGRNVLYSESRTTTTVPFLFCEITSTTVISILMRDNALNRNTFNFTVPEMTAGEIYYITFKRNGDIYSLWLNGVDIGDDTNATIGVTTIDRAAIGAIYYNSVNPSLFFTGSMMKCELYGSALSDADIVKFHNDEEIEGTTLKSFQICGLGDYEYSVDGNGASDWAGTGTHFDYLSAGSFYYSKHGWSLWQDDSDAKEYVPYNEDGNPQDVSAILGGTFALVRNYPGSTSYWNYAPALLEFNPLIGSIFDVFDKSNSTFHVATGGMEYYDSDYPYRWRTDELETYANYNAYFNAAYQDRIFIKNRSNLLKEILNYKQQQSGNALAWIKTYCGIT